jgi:Ca2+-binding RTX toxin-like protein
MDATRPRTLPRSGRAAWVLCWRRLGRAAVVGLMGFFLFGPAAGPAKAGIVTLEDSTLGFVSDDPNRAVNVAFSQSEDVVTISSLGDTLSDPPAPCTYVGSSFDVIACDLTGVDSLAATGGAGGDRITVESTLPATLDGGPGNDYLVGGRGEDYIDGEGGRDELDAGPSADVVASQDGARDARLSCGAGQDFAIVDPPDPVIGSGSDRCERIDDGTQTKPQAGRLYVQPDSCGGSREVGLGPPAMSRWVPLRYPILLETGYQGRPAPRLNTAKCAARLTAIRRQGRSASAAVLGDAVAIKQTARRRVTTTLSVESPSCPAGARGAGAAARASKVRVSTRGRPAEWRVKGDHVIVGSRGTDWTTVERCRSATTIVHRGRVRVFDRVSGERRIVRGRYSTGSSEGG